MPFVTLPCAPLCIPSNLPLSRAVPTKMPLGHRKPQLVGWSHPARQSAFFSYLGIIHCSSCSLPGSLHPETSRPLLASGGGWLQLPGTSIGRSRRVLLGFSPARRAGKASCLALPRAAVVFVKAMLSRCRRAMCTYWQQDAHLWSSSSTTRPHSLRIDSDRGPGLSLPTRLPNMYLR